MTRRDPQVVSSGVISLKLASIGVFAAAFIAITPTVLLAQTGAREEALVDYDDGVADAGVARIGNVPLLGTEHSERQFGHLL